MIKVFWRRRRFLRGMSEGERARHGMLEQWEALISRELHRIESL